MFISLYKERRFSKLEYSAASLFDCLPQFEKLLERTAKNNLLIRGCKLYLESDYIRAALKALGNFTYYVTMPFLNCIERCDQNQLVEILPKVHDYLKEKNIFSEALKPFHVPWRHVNMESQNPSSDLDHYLLDEMCFNASKGIEIQCAREYWKDHGFAEDMVTSIVDLSEDQRKNLPTENLVFERYLASFGHIAASFAAHCNKKFKAKRIRDDRMFRMKMSKTKLSRKELTREFLKYWIQWKKPGLLTKKNIKEMF